MYLEIPGGRKVVVDEGYECWLPPVPEQKEILFSNLPREEQYWKREPLPEYYLERWSEEMATRRQEQVMVNNGLKKKVTFVDPMLERYRRREWLRRTNGIWFMNDGEATYITGHHYFYLQWCKFDHKENNGYPFYYEFSRDNFYFRQYCEEDPKCLGYMIIGPRGTGKSNEELACIVNNATRTHDFRCALQSKSFDDDAKKVLVKAKLVPLFNNLPRFFKPEFNHGTNPEEKLVFIRNIVKGKGASDMIYGEDQELTSMIFAVHPGEKVLDGDTLGEIFEDEIGKVNPRKIADIHKRHEVNVKCVFRNHRKIGLLRKTSTVEEMDEGGDECAKLWKDSNPKERDGNGQTVSKIYRRFISALDTDTSMESIVLPNKEIILAACNKYGKVNREIANQKIMNDRETVKHDLKVLSGRMRKSPRYVEEAFIKDQSKSIFNVFICATRLNQIHNMKRAPYTKGNLYWVNDKEGGKVSFAPDDHAGRFYWAWFPNEFSGDPNPDKWKILNNVHKEHGYDMAGNHRELTFPKNDSLFSIGTDPIKFSKTKDPRASKAAAHGFRKFDIMVDYGKNKKDNTWESHNFIFEYIERPEDPNTYFMDIGMACHFLGCSVLPESNIKSLVQYFMNKGWEKFLMFPMEFPELDTGNQEDAGFSSTPEVIDTYTRKIITFINEHGMRMPFDRTIESWMNFDPSNTTVSDATVSSGFTLVGSEKRIEKEEEGEETIDSWFTQYSDDGDVSRPVHDDFDD